MEKLQDAFGVENRSSPDYIVLVATTYPSLHGCFAGGHPSGSCWLFSPQSYCFLSMSARHLAWICSHPRSPLLPYYPIWSFHRMACTTGQEVQSFVGFVNFYQRFIKAFPHHTSAPVLIFPDDSCPYCVEANSSNMVTGAVLSQWTSLENGGKWHPIAFFSKSLSPIEQNYKIHDKEMLAIIHALEEWQNYCRGSFKNKAVFFFNWPPYFSIFSHCLQFQKTQKQEKSRITT